jgi:hypothetical protein
VQGSCEHMPVKEQTGATYQSAQYMKGLPIAESKVGKTAFLTASCLGALPWQKEGGLVDRPENLHVITFDSNAAGGLARFLTQTCGAPAEATKFRIYNLQDAMTRTSLNDDDYNMDLYNDVLSVLDTIRGRAGQGVHAVLISSLTGLAAGLERALIGPPKGKGYSDPSKWKALAHQLHEIQNFAQLDQWHIFWEAHLDKPAQMKVGKNDDGDNRPKESIRVSGEAGRNWAYNVEQVFRLRRMFGQKAPGTQCDVVYLDTKPSLEFIAAGRGFTETLEAKEYCLTSVARKLGCKTGNWGAKAVAPKKLIPVVKKTA